MRRFSQPRPGQKWIVSPDGRVYTFTLKPGRKFANGNPLRAIDVKNSSGTRYNLSTGSTTMATYLGNIEGVKEK